MGTQVRQFKVFKAYKNAKFLTKSHSHNLTAQHHRLSFLLPQYPSTTHKGPTKMAAAHPVPLSDLAHQYQTELQTQYNNMRKYVHERSREFTESVTKSGEFLKEAEEDPQKRLQMGIVQPLKDLSPIAVVDLMLLNSFSWLTIMLFAYALAFNVVSLLTEPLLLVVFTDFQSACLMLLIPFFAYKSVNAGMDLESRFNLLLFAFAEGIAAGHVFYDYHLNMPLPFIVPLCIAAAAHLFALSKKERISRLQFIGISLGLSFATNLLLGWAVAEMKFAFLLAALFYSLGALFTLQYYIEHWNNDHMKDPYFYMFTYVCFTVGVQVPLLLLFGDKD